MFNLISFDKNSKDRNQLLRREWLRKSTNFMFNIKNIIVSLRKKEQTTDLYNLYQRFQLDCLEFRIYSGYSSSVLTASLSASTYFVSSVVGFVSSILRLQ